MRMSTDLDAHGFRSEDASEQMLPDYRKQHARIRLYKYSVTFRRVHLNLLYVSNLKGRGTFSVFDMGAGNPNQIMSIRETEYCSMNGG